jgi:hypothetical protein
MPPTGSIIDLSEDVLASTAEGLSNVWMTCLRDQVIAPVFEFKCYLIADATIPVVDTDLCIDVVNTA